LFDFSSKKRRKCLNTKDLNTNGINQSSVNGNTRAGALVVLVIDPNKGCITLSAIIFSFVNLIQKIYYNFSANHLKNIKAINIMSERWLSPIVSSFDAILVIISECFESIETFLFSFF
jgi:hypothetical protein